MNAWCYFFFTTADAFYTRENTTKTISLRCDFQLKKNCDQNKNKNQVFFFKVNNLSLKNQL